MSLSEQSLALRSQSTQHLAPAGEEARTPGGAHVHCKPSLFLSDLSFRTWLWLNPGELPLHPLPCRRTCSRELPVPDPSVSERCDPSRGGKAAAGGRRLPARPWLLLSLPNQRRNVSGRECSWISCSVHRFGFVSASFVSHLWGSCRAKHAVCPKGSACLGAEGLAAVLWPSRRMHRVAQSCLAVGKCSSSAGTSDSLLRVLGWPAASSPPSAWFWV